MSVWVSLVSDVPGCAGVRILHNKVGHSDNFVIGRQKSFNAVLATGKVQGLFVDIRCHDMSSPLIVQ